MRWRGNEWDLICEGIRTEEAASFAWCGGWQWAYHHVLLSIPRRHRVHPLYCAAARRCMDWSHGLSFGSGPLFVWIGLNSLLIWFIMVLVLTRQPSRPSRRAVWITTSLILILHARMGSIQSIVLRLLVGHVCERLSSFLLVLVQIVSALHMLFGVPFSVRILHLRRIIPKPTSETRPSIFLLHPWNEFEQIRPLACVLMVLMPCVVVCPYRFMDGIINVCQSR